MGDAAAVQIREHRPQLFDDRVAIGIGQIGELAERQATAAQHQHGVVVDRCAGGDDPIGEHIELRGEQRDERLVLDLLQPTDAQRRTGLAVPEGAPQGRRQRRVVCVAAVHLDHQLSTVAVSPEHLEHAGALAGSRAQRHGIDPDLLERSLHVTEAGPTRRRAEDEMHDGSRDGAEQNAGDGTE